MDRIDMTRNRDRGGAIVNAVMNFPFHKLREISWLAENHLASQEGLCSMELVSSISYLLSTFCTVSTYMDLINFSPFYHGASALVGQGSLVIEDS
jgi:hypothetical protein